MADTSDVEAALVSFIGGVVYPSGTGQPSALAGAAPCRIYRGWPDAAKLDTDLAGGNVNISVFPTRPTRKTTRYPKDWQKIAGSPTLTVSGPVAGTGNTWRFTFGGTGGASQLAGVLIAGAAYVFPLGASDTPTTVATALASSISGASHSGAVLILPAAGTDTPVARIGMIATGWIETRRQEQHYQVSFWCPTPALRDSAVSLIDAQIANIDFLTTSDGSACRITLASDITDDVVSKDALWRRILTFCIEYPTTLTQQQPEMLFGELTVSTHYVIGAQTIDVSQTIFA